MPNKFYLLLIGVTAMCQIAKGQSEEWQDKLYKRHNYKSFSHTALAQQPIDLEAIDYPLLHAAIFYATNEQRKRNGLPVFQHSEALEKAAFEHSIDMVEKNFLSHYSKIKRKKTPNDRLELVGIVNAYAAENVAYSFALQMSQSESYFLPSQTGGFFSKTLRGKPVPPHTYLSFAKNLVQQWMDSPGHRQNIVNATFVFLGCGAYLENTKGEDDFPMFKCTQNFSSKDAPSN